MYVIRFILMHYNGEYMRRWALWNTKLSICYTVYLMLKCSFLPAGR